MVGYVFRGGWAERNRALFARFFAMTSEAKKILAEIACRVAAARSPDRHQRRRRTGPYVAAAARSGLSLVWKIVLIVELLGRPSGVGFEIGVAFQLFDVTRILAYALTFVAVMLAIENLLVQPLE